MLIHVKLSEVGGGLTEEPSTLVSKYPGFLASLLRRGRWARICHSVYTPQRFLLGSVGFLCRHLSPCGDIAHSLDLDR